MVVNTTLDAVDRVNLVDDERFDIPDAQALQELVSEYVVRMVGGLFGGAHKPGDSSTLTVSGSLNTITFDTSTLSATAMTSKCMLLNFRQNSTGDDEGQVVWYDPSDVGAQTTIDLSSFQAGSLTPFIWAKRFTIPTDADTRRKWVSPAETVFSLATRQRHRVEWAAEVGDRRVSTGDNQWFVVAQIESWSIPVSGVPTIRTWHPFDAGSPISSGNQDSWTIARLFGGVDTSTLGVNQAMRMILTQLMRHRKVDGTVHPLTSAPVAGLDDLKVLSDAAFDALGDLAVTRLYFLRILADGAGGWSKIAGDELGELGATLTVTFSGWIVDIAYGFTLRHVQMTTAGPSATGPGVVPFDIVVQYSHDPIVASSRGIKIFVQTMNNLVNTTSFSWGGVPPSFPPSGTIIDVVVGA